MISRQELESLLCKVNKVTAYHRHGNKIPKRALDELSNYQIDIEEKIREEKDRLNKKKECLDYFISLIKEEYTDYEYYNNLDEYIEGDYKIQVYGVEDSANFMKWVGEKILLPCIDDNVEIPLIIPFKEKKN